MKEKRLITFLVLQLSAIIYSLSGVFSKLASFYDFLSFHFFINFLLEIGLLSLYAFLWQQIITKLDLSIAYANKSISLFWSIIFSVIIFREFISINNIIGVFFIIIGVYLVNRDV